MSWASGRVLTQAFLSFGVALAFLPVVACVPQRPPRPQAIGEAYVLPETLQLRRDVAANSGAAATVKRGERLEILGRRRRFVKVRTAADVEGWTEQSLLLTPQVHRQIERLHQSAASLPSLGVYRARDTLNIHIDPQRSSPSIYQLKEEEKVDLLGRRLMERGTAPGQGGKTAPLDEWCLVRTTGGQKSAGWVLARMIDADIPDEVAQYAEGRRITSYFALSEVIDAGKAKTVWLWTTTERSLESYDFDSIRVFNWGRRRHRYETARIERDLKGYFPVSIVPSVETKRGKGPGFAVTIEKKDGRRYTRRYVMVGYQVLPYAEEPAGVALPLVGPAEAAAPEPSPPQPPWYRRLWESIRR